MSRNVTGGLVVHRSARPPNFASSDDAGPCARVYDEDTQYWLAALTWHHDLAGVFRVCSAQVICFVG